MRFFILTILILSLVVSSYSVLTNNWNNAFYSIFMFWMFLINDTLSNILEELKK